MRTKKCICGNRFYPNNPKNIRCPLCASNHERVEKYKYILNLRSRRYKSKSNLATKIWKVRNIRKNEEYEQKYRKKNREWFREYNRQYYIKRNLP